MPSLWATAALGMTILVAGSWLGSVATQSLIARDGAVSPWLRHLRGVGVWAAALGGFSLAFVAQSSSLAVILVGPMVDGGLLTMSAGWAAVVGANIGGTVLPHVLSGSLGGWLMVGGAVVACGLAVLPKTRPIATFVAGIVLVLCGLEVVSRSFVFGPVLPEVTGWWAYASGLIVTTVAFSSGVSIALAQRVVAQGTAPITAGIRFVLGANVGTTADVLVAALGTGRRGRAVAGFHLAFNVFSSLWGLPLLWVLGGRPLAGPIRACGGLACVNSAINVLTATVALPLLAVWAARSRGREVRGYW